MTKILVAGGVHHNTLGVIRSLGEAGYAVTAIVIRHGLNCYFAHSRYIQQLVQVDTIDQFVPALLSLQQDIERPIVLSCSDDISEQISLNWDVLSAHFILPGINQQGRLAELQDKLTMNDLATQAGLMAIPSYIAPFKKTQLTFPCISKPIVSSHGSKAEISILSTWEELEQLLKECPDNIFVQPYLTKSAEFQLIGCSLKGGEQVIIPGATSILRAPHNTNTGFLQYGELTMSQQELLIPCQKFLQECRYSGLFSMEFMQDDRGNTYFLEINFRNDGNAYCVTRSGINLPAIWVKANLGEDICSLITTPKTIYSMPEFQDFRSVIHRELGFIQWLKDIHRTSCFMVANRRDPKPFFTLCRDYIHDVIQSHIK